MLPQNTFESLENQNLIINPRQTPISKTASSNPVKRFHQFLNLPLSKATTAKIKEIRLPHTKVAAITTKVCFQFFQPVQKATRRPANADRRIVIGAVDKVIRRSSRTRKTALASAINNNVVGC